MKLTCNVSNIQVLTKRVFEGKTKPDGTKNIYYQLGINTGNELGEVGCTLEVYDQVILNKTYDFVFSYETRYDKNFIRFDKALPSGIDKK